MKSKDIRIQYISLKAYSTRKLKGYTLLEEIRDFFNRHKGEIAKATGDADVALRDSLKAIKESTSTNMVELNAKFVEQSENFKDIIKEEQATFERISKEIATQFETQLGRLPLLNQQLEEIATIPKQLDILVEKIEESNKILSEKVTETMQHTISQIQPKIIEKKEDKSESPIVIQSMPNWMRISDGVHW